MSQEYQYFVIPYEAVNKQEPGFTVWYATWSTSVPTLDAGMTPPMVVGFAEADKVPEGAKLLGGSTTKTPPIPPPPPPALANDLEGYQLSFDEWAKRRRSL